jgi:hypothetical protein
MTVLIVGIVLSESGCVSSRRMTERTETRRIWSDVRESERDSVVVTERDTVREVTTVMIQLGAGGDTTFQSVVTDRERLRDRSRSDRATHRSEVRVDTVYVERRDSVLVKNSNQARASPLLKILKWSFWIVVGLIALTVVLRIRT